MKYLSLLFLLCAPAFAQQQVITVGTLPNDHKGDSARVWAGKDNANFAQLFGTAGFILSPSAPTPVTLSADTTLPGGFNQRVLVDPSVVFNHLYRFDNLVPYIPKPVGGLDVAYMVVDSSLDAYKNYGAIIRYVKVSSTTANTVAIWPICESSANGANCWATNPVGLTSASGATAITDETDCGTLVSGGLNYCLVVASTGYYPAQVGIQLQTNRWAAPLIKGIYFNASANGQSVSDDLVSSSNSTIALRAIKFAGIFTATELTTPSFQVAGTPINKLISASVVGDGTTAVYSFVSTVNPPWVGSKMITSGFGNALFNIASPGCTVTAASLTSASCLNVNNATTTNGAVTTLNPTITVTGGSLSGTTCTLSYSSAASTGYPATGNKITVASVLATGNALGQNLSGYNGQFTVLTGSATQVTYSCPLAAGNYVSGGTIAPYPISAVTAVPQMQAATAPGNTAKINTVSSGQGATVANLQISALSTGLLYLNNTTNYVDSSGNPGLNAVLTEVSAAPTIVSGFNTSGYSITGVNTLAFKVTVGTGTASSVGVVGMPAPSATTGWACSVSDVTTPGANMVQQTASGVSSVTVTNYVRTTGVAGNFPNSDVLVFHCGSF